MSDWISVDEKLPLEQDYQSTYETLTVLVSNGDIVCECDFAVGGNHIGKPWRKFSDCTLTERDITHWMPLPEPPK